jgi:hypothetical protein
LESFQRSRARRRTRRRWRRPPRRRQLGFPQRLLFLFPSLPAAHSPDTRRRLGTEEGPATLWPLCAGDEAQRRTAVGGVPFAPEGVLSFGRGGGVPPSTALFFDRRLGMPMRIGLRGTARPRWRRSLPTTLVSFSIFSFDLLLGI